MSGSFITPKQTKTCLFFFFLNIFKNILLSASQRWMKNSPREKPPGPRFSKLTTSLVNVSLKFQTLISQICQYFLLKKFEKLLSFFQQKI